MTHFSPAATEQKNREASRKAKADKAELDAQKVKAFDWLASRDYVQCVNNEDGNYNLEADGTITSHKTLLDCVNEAMKIGNAKGWAAIAVMAYLEAEQ